MVDVTADDRERAVAILCAKWGTIADARERLAAALAAAREAGEAKGRAEELASWLRACERRTEALHSYIGRNIDGNARLLDAAQAQITEVDIMIKAIRSIGEHERPAIHAYSAESRMPKQPRRPRQ